MKKSWKLIPKILSGEKRIETRWYKNKSRPWNRIKAGDEIYFKDSGEMVTVKAVVSKVEQYEDLTENKISELLKKYSTDDLGIKEIPQEIKTYVSGKKYAIIVHLESPTLITPFNIDKTGYGNMSAWICVDDIKKVLID